MRSNGLDVEDLRALGAGDGFLLPTDKDLTGRSQYLGSLRLLREFIDETAGPEGEEIRRECWARIPAVIQDADTSEVLMVGFMNDEALARTRATGFATFFSRTRNTLWTKGETSGNRLQVVELLIDCDDDTVLMKVTRLGDGTVCHTGTRSCFRKL